MNLKIYTDGGARGNPGPAGIGVVIYNENNEVIEKHKKYIGVATNNVAEYEALLCALELAKKYIPCNLSMFMDSELICNQMLGIYKVKHENLLPYFIKIRNLLPGFNKVSFQHVPRNNNKAADKLVNEAIDAISKSGTKDII